MSRESAQFAQMVCEAGVEIQDGADDVLFEYCSVCHRTTTWEFVEVVCEHFKYRCTGCGRQRLYIVPE